MDSFSWLPFDSSPVELGHMDNLFPSIYRKGRFKDDLAIASSSLDFLESELLVDRLNSMHDWLWVVGRPMPPRPLNHQLAISRTLVLTEHMDLHLVWTRQRQIFLKPIPRYLLNLEFWREHLQPRHVAPDSPKWAELTYGDHRRREKLAGCALGFLFSYVALIAYESDHRIAVNDGLLPSDVSWPAWRRLSRELLQKNDYTSLNPRFWYGELRLGRLNDVSRYRYGRMGGYSTINHYRSYVDFVTDNFAHIATAIGFVVIILEALQVGVATTNLENNQAFQNFAYGFTIFALVCLPAGAALIMAVLLFNLCCNLRATTRYHEQRMRSIKSQSLDGTESTTHRID